ncbi:MAG TPA: pyridoxamine 5'-phosphate oxidase family protein [Candidatus Limnocylindrales bacterium]|nr:pyridoxamine 5'-phosphate oxidase family protein [Candidatus Limnocylindrales bacterium]
MEQDADAAARRTFLRRLGGQAIDGAGKLAGLSGVVRRSVVAAGEAAVRELDPAAAAPDPAAEAATPPPPRTTGPAPARPPTPTSAQEVFLAAARSGTLAVTDPAGGPHVSRVRLTWSDGAFRIPSGMFSARANAIDRDGRVGLLVEDPVPGGDRWVAVAGTATLEPQLDQPERAVIVVRPTRFTWQIG